MQMINNIRSKYDALVQAFKDEGLEPRITLWLHNHLQESGSLAQDKAIVIAEFIKKDNERVYLRVNADKDYNTVDLKLSNCGEFYASVDKPKD